MDLFPHLSDEQSEMLDVSKLKTESDYEQYIQHLSEYLLPFPIMTEQQLKKCSQNKKIKVAGFIEYRSSSANLFKLERLKIQ